MVKVSIKQSMANQSSLAHYLWFSWDDCANISSNGSRCRPARIPDKVLQRIILLSVFMFLALVGNVTLLIVVCRTRMQAKQPIYVFFISLAASDILIGLFSMPVEVLWEVWMWGQLACKGLTYLQFILFASTAHIHMCVAWDRWEAIATVHKQLTTQQRMAKRYRMIAGSWLLAVIIALPQLFIFKQVEVGVRSDGSPISTCKSAGYTGEWQRKLYVTWTAVYMFLMPLVFIAICYTKIARAVWIYDRKLEPTASASRSGYSRPDTGQRSRNVYVHSNNTLSTGPQKPLLFNSLNSPTQTAAPCTLSQAKIKTLQVTVCVLVSYTFCWIPYFSVALLNVWSDYKYKDSISNSMIGVLAQCLCWFSSCINPIIYGCFNLSAFCRWLPVKAAVLCRCRQEREPRSLMVNGRQLPLPLRRQETSSDSNSAWRSGFFRKWRTRSASAVPNGNYPRDSSAAGQTQALLGRPWSWPAC